MTHFKRLMNPDYLGAYAFEPGQEMTLTIGKVQLEPVMGADGKKEDCIVCHFKEQVKPMILNATNCKAIAKLYRTPYIENWAGKQIILRVQQVRAFGDVVDALRVKPELPPKPEEIKCSKCGHALIGVGDMTAKALSDYTRKKYGSVLCAACAKQMADEQKKTEEKAEEKAE